ncbi:MAG TPA: hypothetical protein DD618_01155 [Acholeplasmatales bacterium]|nr:hypothetical protein [Acholeplasmatales bacterium]
MAKFCSNCGAELSEDQEVCLKCGVLVGGKAKKDPFAATAPNGKSKMVAGLFGILLGGFGIHKFYLGQTGLGVVYLLFCWTGIPSIIGLIEGILLLTMTDADFIEKYGKN